MARAKRASPRRPKAIEPSETEIHIAVAEHLRRRGRKDMLWFHCPNGGKRSKSEASLFKAMGVTAGIPDLVLIMDGRVYGLELKTTTGRTSKDQDVILDAFRRAGGFAVTAYGIDAALDILTAWGMFGRKTATALLAGQFYQGIPPHAVRQ